MRITSLEFAQDKTLADKVKRWGSQLNLAAKSAEAKVFDLAGPAMLQVRMRRGQRQAYNFMGGEKLRISSVTIDRKMDPDCVEINVIFNPADLTLAAEFASLTMPLAEAIDHFPGLEEWANVAMTQSVAAINARSHEAAIVASIPTVEAVRASEEWGAW